MRHLLQYRVPALLAVGLEGFWGLIICAIALPILTAVHGSNGLPLDSLPSAVKVHHLAAWVINVCKDVAITHMFASQYFVIWVHILDSRRKLCIGTTGDCAFPSPSVEHIWQHRLNSLLQLLWHQRDKAAEWR